MKTVTVALALFALAGHVQGSFESSIMAARRNALISDEGANVAEDGGAVFLLSSSSSSDDEGQGVVLTTETATVAVTAAAADAAADVAATDATPTAAAAADGMADMAKTDGADAGADMAKAASVEGASAGSADDQPTTTTMPTDEEVLDIKPQSGDDAVNAAGADGVSTVEPNPSCITPTPVPEGVPLVCSMVCMCGPPGAGPTPGSPDMSDGGSGGPEGSSEGGSGSEGTPETGEAGPSPSAGAEFMGDGQVVSPDTHGVSFLAGLAAALAVF